MKYNVKNEREFITCINRNFAVYIEEEQKDFPIPLLSGVIFPFSDDSITKIALVTRKNNADIMSDYEFYKIAYSLDLTPETRVTILNTNVLLDLYDELISKNHNLFVIDNMFEQVIMSTNDNCRGSSLESEK